MSTGARCAGHQADSADHPKQPASIQFFQSEVCEEPKSFYPRSKSIDPVLMRVMEREASCCGRQAREQAKNGFGDLRPRQKRSASTATSLFPSPSLSLTRLSQHFLIVLNCYSDRSDVNINSNSSRRLNLAEPIHRARWPAHQAVRRFCDCIAIT